ncbi:phospholipase D-like domain-containing protein [Candidatus Halobonum tyrrellensis]|uniref:Phospholipase D/transphosphatidylase n=1 Tax=Candidatus Halobonum tyrrellensis G22 TaxID=1324957 RepID=V4HLR3_9EURY|nr:phospholipase D-like domain-containing protein [Candidatus Halobonum tyrrellensis]ESP88839.1 phospholipase D/transphosphatidylase [Candidatus Halobonum tyrrellensis G22]
MRPLPALVRVAVACSVVLAALPVLPAAASGPAASTPGPSGPSPNVANATAPASDPDSPGGNGTTPANGTNSTDRANGTDRGTTGSAGPPTAARIAGAYPNPVAADDAGEYVALALPAGNRTWTLSDGEGAATVRGGGRVVLAASPAAVPNGTAGRVVAADLRLSNAGERLALHRGGTADGTPAGPLVDAARYDDAPEGERWLRPAENGSGSAVWRPLGYTPRSAVGVGGANATAFVLPDAPEPAVETLRRADRRLLLAAYTFGSERAADALVAAEERGVDARLLVEGGPVGGVSTRSARILDRLVAAGVEVRVVAGSRARFRYHHAKYAVVDDTALVLTENWKPAGVGGASSRGWGVALRSDRAADELAGVFAGDAGWRDARPWGEFRDGRTFESGGATNGSYPARVDPAEVRVENATLLTAPGNAQSGVVGVIDAADERVDVVQPTVERGPFVAACRRAAERGVRVRILLSGAWYAREENEALVASLNGWADRTGAPLSARVADPAGRYGKIHAKGVVADDRAVVGSLNWNPTSAGENREVAVVLRGESVADYYADVFDADWRGGRGGVGGLGVGTVPPALGVAAVAAAALVVLYASRRVRFVGVEGRADDGRRE